MTKSYFPTTSPHIPLLPSTELSFNPPPHPIAKLSTHTPSPQHRSFLHSADLFPTPSVPVQSSHSTEPPPNTAQNPPHSTEFSPPSHTHTQYITLPLLTCDWRAARLSSMKHATNVNTKLVQEVSSTTCFYVYSDGLGRTELLEVEEQSSAILPLKKPWLDMTGKVSQKP